ncbi:MAG: glycosyltransferase family 1 protein [Planctomycetota bacterium]
MRIGIDAHILGKGKGGVERYVRELALRLPRAAPEHEYLFFVRKALECRGLWEGLRNVQAVPLLTANPLLERPLLLPWLARRHRLDVLHVQRIAPPFPGCAVVVTIHDVLPLTMPRECPGFSNALVRLLTPGTVRRCARILTVSSSTQQDLARLFPEAAARIAAIPNGVDHGFFRPAPAGALPNAAQKRLGLEQPYVLYAGAIEPRKNLLLVLRAFEQCADLRRQGALLVLAGLPRTPAYRRELDAFIRGAGLAAQVRWALGLGDQEYLELVQAARLFLAPSLGEGFDLPPLEAMACGVPTICSDIPVHSEFFAGAAEFFARNEAAALAQSLTRLWQDGGRCTTLRAAGLRKAAEFSWDKTANLTAQQYRTLQP